MKTKGLAPILALKYRISCRNDSEKCFRLLCPSSATKKKKFNNIEIDTIKRFAFFLMLPKISYSVHQLQVF
jgi:hypothetical protein